MGQIGSSFTGNTIKIYGGTRATNWNTMLTSDVAGELHINGARIMTSSDDRLKKDKKRIENACNLLQSINGKV